MRQITALALASLASLATATASHAAGWAAFVTNPGALRLITSANQISIPASNATSYLTVTRCTGVNEYPMFAVISPTTCVANGPDYQIVMEIINPTQTKVSIMATAASCAIRSVSFGTPNSRCGYDLTNPNPGTAGSLTGANPVPIAGSLIGAWTAQVKFDNAAYYAGSVAQLDLYTRMAVSFTSCFDVGDLIQFTVDTDLIG